MADQQNLLEFTDSLLSDLERGAITPQEAISACQQYAYLRESLASRSSQVAEAALTGDEELASLLRGVFTEAHTKLKELPSFQGTEPDAPSAEKEIRDTAFLRTAAMTRAKESTKTKLAPLKERRRDFIHTIVSKYSSTMPGVTDKQIDAVVDGSLAAASREATTAQTRERFAEMMAVSAEEFGGAPLSADQRSQLKASISASLTEQNDYFSAAVSANKSEQELVSTIYNHLELKRPDVLADVVLNTPDTQKDEAVLRGIKLAQVAESLERRTNEPRSTNGFLSPGNAKGVSRGLQQATDGILSLVGEPVREIIYKEKVNGTLRSLLTSTQQLTDRLGEAFVHSAVFTQISQNLSRSLSEKAPTNGGSILGDVFSSVFRGPLDPALNMAAKDRILDYFELARASANAPKGYGFLPPGVLPWEAFASLQKRSTELGRGLRSSWLPFLSLGSLGGRMGDAFAGVVDGATSFLFTGSSLPNQLRSSRQAALIPTPIFEDMPLLIAIVVVVVIIILYIFPSALSGPQLNYATRVGQLFSSLYDKTQESSSSGTIGQVTLSCAKIDGVHLLQMDPRWAFRTCAAVRPEISVCHAPTSCTIGASGCGSTSATMILNSFGASADLPTVWDTQHKNNGYAYYSDGCASYWSGPINILESAGLSVSQIDESEMESVFKKCGLVLAFVYEKWLTGAPTGHIIVITGVSHEGGVTKVTTLDPARSEGSVSTITSNPTHYGDISVAGYFSVVK